MTITEAVARFVVRTTPADLDDKATRLAQEALSDCIGCMIAGSSTDLGAIMRRVIAEPAAQGKATVVGSARQVGPDAAAFVNGALGHAHDFDDVLWTMYGHPSVAIAPTALALAESTGASGRELLLAYAIGVEITGKIGRYAVPHHYEHGWHTTGTVGVLGAAGTAAKLLGLNEQQTAMALGLAASQSAGVRQNFGTMSKPFHAGNAGRAGIVAAQLAREGFTSSLRAMEGEYGWFETLDAGAKPHPDDLGAALGKPWDLHDPGIVLKRYPSCGCTHCALDAMIMLKQQHRFAAADVAHVHCASHPLAPKVLIHSRPRTGLEGKFSMQYCLAVAAVDGAAGLRHFEPPWVDDPRVRDLIPHIDLVARDDLVQGPAADAISAEVMVELRNGTRLVQKVMVPAGDPRNPMTTADRGAKFLDCAHGVIAPGVAERLFADLERLHDMRSLSTLLAPLRSAA